jgi:hypothetical protein
MYMVINEPDRNISTTSLAVMRTELCGILSEKWFTAIQHKMVLKTRANYYSYPGTYNALGIINASRTYLIHFALYREYNSNEYKVSFYRATVLKAKQVTSIDYTAVPGVSGTQVPMVVVTGTDIHNRQTKEYFVREEGRYTDGSYSVPVVKNVDGTFSIRIYSRPNDIYPEKKKISFLTPFTTTFVPQNTQMQPDRNFVLESQNKVKPVYNQASCNLENEYADEQFHIGAGVGSGGYVTLGVNYGDKPVLHMTTPVSGYVPSEWGKILFDISLADARTKVTLAEVTRSGAKVEMLTIAGHTVKHIGPVAPDRTCDYGSVHDMYQTLHDGAIITVSYTRQPNEKEISSDALKEILTHILSTLSISNI